MVRRLGLLAEQLFVDEDVFAEEGVLLSGRLATFAREQVLERGAGVLQLLDVERLAPDGEVDVILDEKNTECLRIAEKLKTEKSENRK